MSSCGVTKEVQIGATIRFKLVTTDRPGGSRVAPDTAPTLQTMRVNGALVDETLAAYANAVAQRVDAASAAVPGVYDFTGASAPFSRIDEVEYVFTVVVEGITKELTAVATFRDDPASVPGFCAT